MVVFIRCIVQVLPCVVIKGFLQMLETFKVAKRWIKKVFTKKALGKFEASLVVLNLLSVHSILALISQAQSVSASL